MRDCTQLTLKCSRTMFNNDLKVLSTMHQSDGGRKSTHNAATKKHK